MIENYLGRLIRLEIEKIIPSIIIGSFKLTNSILINTPITVKEKLSIYNDSWIIVFLLPITDEGLWIWHYSCSNYFLFANFLFEKIRQRVIEILKTRNIYSVSLNSIVGQDISMVELGIAAGVGERGFNNLLIHPLYGAWLQIDALLVSKHISFYKRKIDKKCLACKKCITACPVGAIGIDYFEKYKCSMVVASPTTKKSKAKALTSNFYIECNECISACPVGKPPERIYEWKQN